MKTFLVFISLFVFPNFIFSQKINKIDAFEVLDTIIEFDPQIAEVLNMEMEDFVIQQIENSFLYGIIENNIASKQFFKCRCEWKNGSVKIALPTDQKGKLLKLSMNLIDSSYVVNYNRLQNKNESVAIQLDDNKLSLQIYPNKIIQGILLANFKTSKKTVPIISQYEFKCGLSNRILSLVD